MAREQLNSNTRTAMTTKHPFVKNYLSAVHRVKLLKDALPYGDTSVLGEWAQPFALFATAAVSRQLSGKADTGVARLRRDVQFPSCLSGTRPEVRGQISVAGVERFSD